MDKVVVDLSSCLVSLVHLIEHFLAIFLDNFYKNCNISATKQAINMGPIFCLTQGGLADLSKQVTMLLKNFNIFTKFATFTLA